MNKSDEKSLTYENQEEIENKFIDAFSSLILALYKLDHISKSKLKNKSTDQINTLSFFIAETFLDDLKDFKNECLSDLFNSALSVLDIEDTQNNNMQDCL